MPDTKNAAMELIEAKQGVPVEKIEQADLFPSPLDNMPTQADTPEARAKSAGRPKGARNKRDTELIQALEKLGYRSPLQGMADMWSRPVDELAAFLECDRASAAKLQLAAMQAAAPYWHKKQPAAIDLQGALAHLNIVLPQEEEAPELIDGESISIGGSA